MHPKAILTALAVLSSVLASPVLANDASADRDWKQRNQQTVSRSPASNPHYQGGNTSTTETRKVADTRCGCAMPGDAHAAMGH